MFFSETIFSDYILLRNCLFRLYPSQELSFQTIPFSGIVFSDYIILMNYLSKLYPFQELSSQTISFAWIVFSVISFSGDNVKKIKHEISLILPHHQDSAVKFQDPEDMCDLFDRLHRIPNFQAHLQMRHTHWHRQWLQTFQAYVLLRLTYQNSKRLQRFQAYLAVCQLKHHV